MTGQLASAGASMSLVGGYGAAVLGSGRRAIPVTLLLGSTYGYLYLILQLEDYALVSGSLGLFVILVGVMSATRHVDWFAMSVPSVRSKQNDF